MCAQDRTRNSCPWPLGRIEPPSKASAEPVHFSSVAPRGSARGVLNVSQGLNVAHVHPEPRHVFRFNESKTERRLGIRLVAAVRCALSRTLVALLTWSVECNNGRDGRDEVAPICRASSLATP